MDNNTAAHATQHARSSHLVFHLPRAERMLKGSSFVCSYLASVIYKTFSVSLASVFQWGKLHRIARADVYSIADMSRVQK